MEWRSKPRFQDRSPWGWRLAVISTRDGGEDFTNSNVENELLTVSSPDKYVDCEPMLHGATAKTVRGSSVHKDARYIGSRVFAERSLIFQQTESGSVERVESVARWASDRLPNAAVATEKCV